MRGNLNFIVANEIYSKITDGTHDSPKQKDHGKPLITSKHIKGRNIDFDSAYLISEDDFDKINQRSQVEKWDVIVSMIGEYCGYCYVERNDNIDYAVKNVGLYKAKTKLEAEWLYYYLISPIGKAYLNSVKSGSSQPYLTLGGLRKLPILYPKYGEEKIGIAKVLSDLDAKIEVNNKINQELEAMAKTLYDYWFVQFDFPDANGKPSKTSGGEMVFNEVLKREIPTGWEDGYFEDVAEIIGGSTPSKADSTNFTNGDGTPWITPKDLSNNKGKKYITHGEFDVTESGIKKGSLKLMPPGTVLLSSRAPIGYLAIARKTVTTNQGFKSFVPKNHFTTEFLYYQIKNKIPLIEARSGGSTFKEVSASTLKRIKIIMPPKTIVKTYQNRVKPIFDKQNILELENQKLSELRDWLLPMLMNGQVTVGEAERELGMVAENGSKYSEG